MPRKKHPLSSTTEFELYKSELRRAFKKCKAPDRYFQDHGWHYLYHAIWPLAATNHDSVLPGLYAEAPDLFCELMGSVRKILKKKRKQAEVQGALYLSYIVRDEEEKKRLEALSDKELADYLTGGTGAGLGVSFTPSQAMKIREHLRRIESKRKG